jgi:hypothetical protein
VIAVTECTVVIWSYILRARDRIIDPGARQDSGSESVKSLKFSGDAI